MSGYIESTTMIVVSTGHFSSDTRSMLDSLIPNSIDGIADHASFRFGWFVLFDLAYDPDHLRPDVGALLRWITAMERVAGNENLFVWVKFDSDGSVIDGLPFHDE